MRVARWQKPADATKLCRIIKTRETMVLQWDPIKPAERRTQQHIKCKVTQIATKNLTYLCTLLTSKLFLVVLEDDSDNITPLSNKKTIKRKPTSWHTVVTHYAKQIIEKRYMRSGDMGNRHKKTFVGGE